MTKNKKQTKRNVTIFACVMIAIVVGLSALSIGLSASLNKYKMRLENVYRKNYFELINNLEDIEVGFTKLIATNSLSTQQQLLQEVYDASTMANVNLTSLPISSNKISHVTTYINDVNGYSTALLTKSYANEKLDESALESIENLYKYSKIILYDLNSYVSSLSGKNSIIKQIKYSDGDSSKFDGGMQVNTTTEKVPTLIYDGPFSDSVTNKEIKGLSGIEITRQQAEEYLQESFEYFGDYTLTYDGQTQGKFGTYNFILESVEAKLYVQITQNGGMILSINQLSVKEGNNDLSADQCNILAHNFATLLGFEDMHSVWYQETDEVVYVNLAPIVDHIIYYPDLIKVKVNKKLGMVVGWEATNYAYNHTNRGTISYKLSFEECRQNLSSALTVTEQNLCVIPNKYVGESVAYEYICEWADYTYYVYIDATTGEELNILRVIDTNNGQLLY